MNTLNKFSSGWKGLEAALNYLVVGINNRTIETGAGLTKSETDGGILISLAAAKSTNDASPATGGGGDDPWRYTPDGEAAGWHSVEAMDGNCNRFSFWVWGGSPK